MVDLKEFKAVVNRNGFQLGEVKFNSSGKPTFDLNLLSCLTSQERNKLTEFNKKLIAFLETWETMKEEYFLEKESRNFKVIRKIGDEEAKVGLIRVDNKKLLFNVPLSEAEIEICLEQLSKQKLTDFYYNGHHYK